MLKEDREGDKEGDADQVFDALYMGVIINQGVQWFDHTGGCHVLACQCTYRPVDLVEGSC